MTYTQQLQWINTLTEKQLSEFLNEAFQSRSGDNAYEETRFFLGHAHRYKDEEEGWNIEVVCSHNPVQMPSGMVDDAPLCQGGRCAACDVSTLSYAKHGICPLCGRDVYGT